MSTIIEILTAAALILSIIIPGGAFLLGERNKKRYKKSLAETVLWISRLRLSVSA